MKNSEILCDLLGVSQAACAYVLEAEEALSALFARVEAVEMANQAKVLAAFQQERIAQRHFAPTTGYGYDDTGRDALDRVFAHALDAEDALVRAQITTGTHAIFLALSGLLEPGDTMLSVTGKPYDTLDRAIGISGDEPGSLKRLGVQFKQVPLKEDRIDMDAVLGQIDGTVKVLYIQRSRGYAWRNALLPGDMPFEQLHRAAPHAAIVVDNCYGEFTGTQEPCAFGADVQIGSLIKNPGGGIAPTGGYIAGKKAFIARIEHKLTVPGQGREVGSYAGGYLPFYQGLFLAPHTTAQSIKTAILFAKVFENAGLVTLPRSGDVRSDIVQALRFDSEEALCAFCRSIQRAAPVDSFVVPEPWEMPGYSDKVIMAAGAFIEGSSIELSADAPIVVPYTAYVQGGLTYSHGRIGVLYAVDELMRLGYIRE